MKLVNYFLFLPVFLLSHSVGYAANINVGTLPVITSLLLGDNPAKPTTFSPAEMEDYVMVRNSFTNQNSVPFVVFMHGSGGMNGHSEKWSRWFESHGVASVFINSAGVRGLDLLLSVTYEDDLEPALTVASRHSNLDFSRYAVMGFSKGGTAALNAQPFLTSPHQDLDFVYALYPGDSGICPNTHMDETGVSVFYGDLDEWGTHQGTREACRTMATLRTNANFYELLGAYHGYDGDSESTFTCCGGVTITIKPDPAALAITQTAVLGEISTKWNLPQNVQIVWTKLAKDPVKAIYTSTELSTVGTTRGPYKIFYSKVPGCGKLVAGNGNYIAYRAMTFNDDGSYSIIQNGETSNSPGVEKNDSDVHRWISNQVFFETTPLTGNTIDEITDELEQELPAYCTYSP